jgi:hypothetical protein
MTDFQSADCLTNLGTHVISRFLISKLQGSVRTLKVMGAKRGRRREVVRSST